MLGVERYSSYNLGMKKPIEPNQIAPADSMPRAIFFPEGEGKNSRVILSVVKGNQPEEIPWQRYCANSEAMIGLWGFLYHYPDFALFAEKYIDRHGPAAFDKLLERVGAPLL